MEKTKAAPNSLSLASLIFGILSVLGSFIVVGTPLFAGLAITFAWLSRGDQRMCGQAAAGNVLAIISIVVSLIVLVILIAVVMTTFVAVISSGGGMSDMEDIIVQPFMGLR